MSTAEYVEWIDETIRGLPEQLRHRPHIRDEVQTVALIVGVAWEGRVLYPGDLSPTESVRVKARADTVFEAATCPWSDPLE